jgi:hypothetical protein
LSLSWRENQSSMNGGETIWAIRRVMMLHEDTEGINYSWRTEGQM